MWAVVRGVVVWLFGDDIVKYTLYAVAGLLVFVVMDLSAATTAIVSQPFGQWQFASTAGGTLAIAGGVASAPEPPVAAAPVPAPHPGAVSDVERAQIARAVGFPLSDLVLAVAISFAEDPAGDPAAMSPRNFNGTYDLGLWQINSIHWTACGGQSALTIPLVNGACAVMILGPGRNWCAWSTYEASCGVGHTGGYRAFMARAQAAVALAAQGG